MRRIIDIFAASLALIVLSPVLLALTLAVIIDSPGNPLYLAWRVGKDGRNFKMWKFRTMIRGAAAMGSITGCNDLRVTRLGRLLRKGKLDELPQFINVLLGQMTLVGPRPESPDIVALYTPRQRAVLAVKPGVTGRVQLDSGDESESVPEGARPDAYYVRHLMGKKLRLDSEYLEVRTPLSDARILLDTAASVLRCWIRVLAGDSCGKLSSRGYPYELRMNSDLQVPFHLPSIGKDEIDEVVRTLKSGWLTTGPRTAQFEQEFRAYVEAPHALAVNSCTSGLHLAQAALRIGPGAEVITSPLTFCATVNTILHTGATPVLADIGGDGNLDPASVVERLSPRTRAIIPVHFAGLPCDMNALWSLARRYRLHVVEDCAHAAGARYQGRPVGAGNPDTGDASDAAVFSFYATKNLTTGEGGMVTTLQDSMAESLRVLCLHGISRDAWNRYSDEGSWYYQVLASGFKYNLSDIQSAIGIHQLRRLEHFIQVRTRFAKLYNELLRNVEEFELPPDKANCRHAWHLYTLRLNLDKLSLERDEFIVKLRAAGISASVHFIPIPLHPFFAEYAQRPENRCPNALALYPRLVSLPLYPAMTEGQIEYVANTAKGIARRGRKKRSFAAR